MIVIKQVLVIRKDLKVRRGKMHVQAAHASIMSYLRACGSRESMMVTYDWLQKYNQTKICLGVESEEELLSIYTKALQAGLPCALVTDSAKTEFEIPTNTALGIGPANADEIDKLTKELKLL
jgi:peptidyl-tRNA hydrolase, PTH2 family